ncbi:hypothetical protein HDZ31DRAFT_68931 [Schizophyllum fasciatum]
MESLNTLASSLPSANQGADQALMNDFKAAALSITNFYRSSRAASARAYDSGYAAACHDIMRMIERGVSADGLPTPMASNAAGAGASANPMNVGRVMDWIEARLEALRAREEEEAEDDGRKDAKDDGRRPIARANPESSPSSPQAPARTLQAQPSTKPAPFNPEREPHAKPDPQSPVPETAAAPMSFPFLSFPAPEALPPQPIPSPSIGAKRRHAVMMMLDNQPGEEVSGRGVSPTATAAVRGVAGGARGMRQGAGAAVAGRRRPRRERDARDRDVVMETADPEDGGRERKRVARR